jgi:hypothetical protein
VAQTDSKFVEHMNTQKATAERLVRWWETFAEYNVEFQHIEGQWNIVTDVLSRSFPKVSHEHTLFAMVQPSNAIQISQLTRENRNKDTGESMESQKVSHEHTFFVTAQPSNAEQILENTSSKDTIEDTEKPKTVQKDTETALIVSNGHDFFATVPPSHANQIPTVFAAIEKGQFAFDYSGDTEFRKL